MPIHHFIKSTYRCPIQKCAIFSKFKKSRNREETYLYVPHK
jgi:uncharacterized protein YcgL (UPF0745 family)